MTGPVKRSKMVLAGDAHLLFDLQGYRDRLQEMAGADLPLFGLLTIKPHLGLLIPFILLAQGNWRAIGAAAITAIIMAILTGVAFGFDVWHGFFTQTRPLMTSIMHAPWGEGYHANSATVFAFMRSLGAGINAAYAVQAIISVTCLITAVYYWRNAARYDRPLLIALSLCLIFLAAPYGYTYEMAGISLACAMLFMRRQSLAYALPLAVLWMWPMVNHFAVQATDMALTAPLVMALCAALMRALRRPTPANSPGPA